VRQRTKAALTAGVAATLLGMLAAVPAPASASLAPSLSCAGAPTGGTVQGGLCVLASGQTTAPNAYSVTIALVGSRGHGPTTWILVAGSLPPGLTMATAEPGTTTVITGNPTQTGTFNFTIKGRAPSGPVVTPATRAYQITITTQGPPDKLLCDAPGDFLISGTCVLPDAITGQPYQASLPTSHAAGGTLSVVAGALPAGLSLSAHFTGAAGTISGTPAPPGVQPNSNFTVQGTGDQGQPLYQAYSIMVDPNQPLTIGLPASGSTLSPEMVGGAYAQSFFLSGGAAPYTWSLASGQLPPGLTLQNSSAGPRDANNELAGTPTTAGTFTFTMNVTDFYGHQATQQFSLTIDPAPQVTPTTLPSGTVGVPYSHDLDLNAQGGTPPYSWFVVNNINELPPGLTLNSTSPNFNNILDGTPTQAGTFSFPMQVQDSQNNTVHATLTITINP
jgi:large repetitive protein